MALAPMLRFLLGAAVGVGAALPAFIAGLVRGARPVHARGVVCRATVTALDEIVGPRLAGPALVRLSGAFTAVDSTAQDVLGLAVRLRRIDVAALDQGDQDLVFGTFESFLTVARDRARVDPTDYLHNEYSSVTPWEVDGIGVATLRLMPPTAGEPARGKTATTRLDADIRSGRAVLTLEVRQGDARTPVAQITLVERLLVDGSELRMSLFRTGRRLTPTGFRNGIRAIVYPVSQAGRRLRAS